MSKKSTAKANYHHGNLKEALVEVAVEIVRADGVAGLSLRKVAKKLGVTQTAPYSHFKDKTSLLAAVATVGFRLFTERMSQEMDKAETLENKINGLGMGYVLFALEEPQLFRLMFGTELSGYLESQEFVQTAAKSYELISDSVAELIDRDKSGRDKSLATITAWSLVHGLATLLVDNKLAVPKGDIELREFIQGVLKETI